MPSADENRHQAPAQRPACTRDEHLHLRLLGRWNAETLDPIANFRAGSKPRNRGKVEKQSRMTFRTTVGLGGKTETEIPVPEDVAAAHAKVSPS